MPRIDEVLRAALNERQYAAAVDPAREVLCLACAGSGKSTTLAYRIANLVALGADPHGIVAFTFTEKAADSIGLQVGTALAATRLPSTVLGAMFIGTIHSYCKYVLGQIDARYRQFDVLDENRLKLYLMSRYGQLGLQAIRQARGAHYFETIKEAADAWSILNDEMLNVATILPYDGLLAETLERLHGGLDRDQFIDFSLMARLVAEALERRDAGAERAVANLVHLMVDEYQDVNPSQERLISQLHARSQTLFAVGDDDQSLYAWRGADISNILEFDRRHPNCSRHTLSRNYRSTRAIVRVADDFASAELGARRMAKDPVAEDPEGARDLRVLWFPHRQAEAGWVADRIQALLGTRYREGDGSIRGLTPGDVAILMRSTRTEEQDGRARHAAFSEALTARGIRFSLEAGGGVFDRPHARVLRDALMLLRAESPLRETARIFFDAEVHPVFPRADFEAFAGVLAHWGREIHAPSGGARRRVYPQQLVHDLLEAFRIADSAFDTAAMRDLGVVSRVVQDVEAVFVSVDSAERFQAILNFLANVAETGYDPGTEDVQRNPDTVTVATVHKVKGLEYPVVFIVDVESGRFPGRIHGYRKWLPREVMAAALGRGAYQGGRDEEARLFYTALTRAERFLYITGSQALPGGRKIWQRSPFSLRLRHAELSNAPIPLPAGLAPHPLVPRRDESVVPTTYSEIRYYLRCPKDYQFRKAFGFSPPIPELFGFGRSVHASVGKLHELFRERSPTGDEAERVARGLFHLKHVPPSREPDTRPGAYENARDKAGTIARQYAEAYSSDFARSRQVEVRFEIPLESAVIAGSIDLLLKEDKRGHILEAEVIDFKAMEGGPDPAANERLEWTELTLQVQLYARAAREVLGEDARTGAVHLLKDNQRISVPVDDEAVSAAVANVEWAVERILNGDFPMRPSPEKCRTCDFRALCAKRAEDFSADARPPALHLPGGERRVAPAFSEFAGED